MPARLDITEFRPAAASSTQKHRSSARKTPRPIDLRSVFQPKFLAKFQSSVRLASSGCLEWTGFIDANGYGRVCVDGRLVGAYRVAWMLAHHATIPEGMVIDHMCCNRACVAASHLESVTLQENTRRIAKPPKDWIPIAESVCFEAFGAGQRWWVVEWRVFDPIKRRARIESRLFRDAERDEAEAFARHMRTLPTTSSDLKPSEEIPGDLLEQLNRVYYPPAVESWLITNHSALGGRSPIDMIRCGHLNAVRALAEAI
ncbi:HNH endonuclease [Mycobacterium phage KristaRAM]|uniref:HNH endonuclease n=3 Tax=Cheoctovirus TaxID=1623281 RepID=A0A385E042_9CAUD|nr:HNH endonuclease [Mycobacterium phage Bobi]YP_009954624.1 HNH endonuclease [Mycobacterium phage Batiatus]YP_009958995.1 HNH endonuclease [Mycobacterium phage KristaRAM]QBP31522.1 HNH endonuclease [Mycobacterium phage Cornucopia]QUE26222.1 HNH endonuclease [Mycobacterium phage Akhila]UAJ16638.1 HNH endonuclease [Mycobacterium phage MilanaBonita]AGS82237.1 HNH endonuclease [Mycobacterium phage Bobi]AVP41698.1 HNH endonuclease [Mycobacterium phage Batiatus]